MLLSLCFVLLTPAVVGAELQEVRFRGKSYKVYVVRLSDAEVQLLWKDKDGEPFSNFNRLKDYLRKEDKEMTFAMNAGIFNPNLEPVGLYIEKGDEQRPLNLKNDRGNFFLKPNGVFYIDDKGKAGLITSEKYEAATAGRKIQYATQSGPQLVIEGSIHPAFTEGSQNQVVRNGVGVIDENTVVFAISQTKVNLYEFAALFKEKYGCQNALYLDGAISEVYGEEDKDRVFRNKFSAMIVDSRPLSKPAKPVVQAVVSKPKPESKSKVYSSKLPLDEYWFDLDLSEDVRGPQRFWTLFGRPDRKLKLALVAGGGFSEPGLIVFNGEAKAPLVEGDSLNGGVFYVTRKNDVGLLNTVDYKSAYADGKMIKHAFQSAQMLISKGKMLSLNSEVMHYSGVGWSSKDNSLVFISTEGLEAMGLQEFAQFFQSLECENALLLSSGLNTQIFINGIKSDLNQVIQDKVPVLISAYSK